MEETKYNRDEAAAYIYGRISEGNKQLPSSEIKDFVSDCMTQEDDYMKEMGFFSDEEEEDTSQGDLIYDEEDAFHFILSGLAPKAKYRKWKEPLLEDLIDDYLENKYDYMVAAGLVE